MDEGRKRVWAIVAGILVPRHLKTADDLFGGPQGVQDILVVSEKSLLRHYRHSDCHCADKLGSFGLAADPFLSL